MIVKPHDLSIFSRSLHHVCFEGLLYYKIGKVYENVLHFPQNWEGVGPFHGHGASARQ